MRLRHILLIALLLPVCLSFAGKDFSIKTVVIDAGHGGKDPGATGPGKINEKDVALAVALKLGNYIKKNFPDVNVIYTRKTDQFIELHERAEIANKNKADLFIAIHCNSAPSSEAYGTSTYVLGLHRTEANLEVAKRENAVILLEEDRAKNYEFDPNSAEGHIIMSMKQNAFLDQSIDMASKIETQFESGAKRKSLGVKQAGFYVLYKTTMPSLLSEIGFISNPEEERFLNSQKGQDEIAQSIFNAFVEYKSTMEKGEPVVDESTSKHVAAMTAATNPDDYVTLGSGKKVKKPQESTGGGGIMIPTKEDAPVATTAAKKEDAKPVVKEEKKEVAVTHTEEVKKADPPKPDTLVKTTVTASTDTKVEKVVEKTEPKTEPKPAVKAPEPVVTEKKETITTTTTPEKTTTETKTVAITQPVKTEIKPTASAATPKKEVPVATPPAAKTETKVVKTEVKTEPTPAKQPVTASVERSESPSPIVFKVQLFALKSELKESERAKMAKVSKVITEEKLPTGLTRYYIGKTNSYAEAKRLAAAAVSNGYIGAFIVGSKDGRHMTNDEMRALETQ